MPIELTGYRGAAINLQTQRSGLQDLRQAEQDEAHKILIRLGDGLRGRSGVVRLLHTSSANKDMKFKDAGGFKGMFLKGDKLRQSGDVVGDLLHRAGLPTAKVEEFKQYVAARGNSGVKTQKVLQYIDALRAESGKTPEEAMSKFGVDLGRQGRRLGRGAAGEVHLVTYRGEQFVFKHPPADKTMLGYLILADQQGNPQLPWEESRKSYAEIEQGSAQGGKHKAAPLLNAPIKKQRGSYDRSPTASVDSDLASEEDLKAFLAQDNKGSAHLDLAEEPSQAPPPTGKLSRLGMAVAPRVKGLPQVITPTVFLVKETTLEGEVVYHAVAGQQQIKQWAKTQKLKSTFAVTGVLMPKASGKQPVDGRRSNVALSDLKPMAQSALSLLKGLAGHGFIHGDIKSENLFWDSSSKTLSVIDTDGLQKVSEDDGSTVAKKLHSYTRDFLNPVAYRSGARLGIGRDLFAIGATLLEVSLTARGAHAKADELIQGLTHGKANAPELSLRNGEYRKGLTALAKEKFAAGSIEDFARQCIIKSIEVEESRLENQNFTFERYADQQDHPLTQLQEALNQVQ